MSYRNPGGTGSGMLLGKGCKSACCLSFSVCFPPRWSSQFECDGSLDSCGAWAWNVQPVNWAL